VFATRLLISSETCHKYNSKASELLKQFVHDYGSLYGHHNISYNDHSLIHLPMFTLLHGPLDNFSLFRYENYLQYMKKSLKSEKYPLQEVYNRIREKQQLLTSQLNVISNYPIFSNEIDCHSHLPFISISDKLYSKCVLNVAKTIINMTNEKDKYFLCQDYSLVTVQYIIKPKNKPIKFMVKKFMTVTEFSDKPIPSHIVY
jgi:hypothetical protein